MFLVRRHSEERELDLAEGRRCEELFVVFIFLSYQQKSANPILTTRWRFKGYKLLNHCRFGRETNRFEHGCSKIGLCSCSCV
jgi:hypothetical protein